MFDHILFTISTGKADVDVGSGTEEKSHADDCRMPAS
jgi:hypothetical protein